MNPWHDIEAGKRAPEEVNVIIEVPMGARTKYELDPQSGLLKLDRFMYSPVHYPGDYGFIPQTYYAGDGDPMDILVLSNTPVHPRTIVKARPIGVLRMIDVSQQDDKIISVHSRDPRFDEIKDIKNLPRQTLRELRHFFEIYKELQNKKVKVLNFLNKAQAYREIRTSIKLYNQKFKKK
jgi:inorganic pyrophosphatase